MTEPVLQARGLEVTFRGRGNRSARAVDGVDLSLGHGEIVAQLGAVDPGGVREQDERQGGLGHAVGRGAARRVVC